MLSCTDSCTSSFTYFQMHSLNPVSSVAYFTLCPVLLQGPLTITIISEGKQFRVSISFLAHFGCQLPRIMHPVNVAFRIETPSPPAPLDCCCPYLHLALNSFTRHLQVVHTALCTLGLFYHSESRSAKTLSPPSLCLMIKSFRDNCISQQRTFAGTYLWSFRQRARGANTYNRVVFLSKPYWAWT